MSEAELLLILVVHLALTGLPGVAAALFGARCGLREVPVLLALGLATTGVTAMLSFWAFYADPLVGESFAYLLVFGSVALAAGSLYGGRLDPALLRRLATPLALWALGSVFLVFLGYMHGGIDTPLATSPNRFSHELPGDNVIPLFFAEWFFDHGHQGTPPIFPGEWLSSDRPPLQLGYVLAQRPFEWGDPGLHYQVLGVILQQLWIVGLWALLLAARVGRVTRALAIATVLVSDIAIVNGFYVWPKMLSAAMLLAAAALVATPLWQRLRESLWAAALVAALLALALLGHGSSIFGVIPLVLIVAVRGLPGWRWIGTALLVGLVIALPWSAYQKYGDPPGDRLTKWMIGGVEQVDDRSPGEAILDSYGEIGLDGAVERKLQNFGTMAGVEIEIPDDLSNAFSSAADGDLEETVRELRSTRFFSIAVFLGLFLVAPVVMLLARARGRRHPEEWSFALTCLALAAIGLFAWGLIMFGPVPARTTIHVGSLALPILALVGATVGLRATFPRFAIYYVGLNAAAMLALYAPALDPPEGSTYSAFAIFAAAASLVAFVAVALGTAGPLRRPSWLRSRARVA